MPACYLEHVASTDCHGDDARLAIKGVAADGGPCGQGPGGTGSPTPEPLNVH